jgi:hypothetical protein
MSRAFATEQTTSAFPARVMAIHVCDAAGKGRLRLINLEHWPRSMRWRLAMLYTIAVVLAVLWLLGLVTSYTMGGFIHILLVLAIIVILVQVIQGRRI